jgi:hypothetical protein
VRARSGKGRSLPENGRCHTGSARPVGAASCRSAAVDGAVLRELAAHDEKRNQRRVSGLLIRRKLRPPRADWLRHMVRPLPHLMVVSLLWSIWAPFLPMQCNASGQVAAPWPTRKGLFSPPDLSRVLMTVVGGHGIHTVLTVGRKYSLLCRCQHASRLAVSPMPAYLDASMSHTPRTSFNY